jgi:acyl carrier protein
MDMRAATYALITAMAPSPAPRLTDDMRLAADLGYDSLRMLELTIALEARLGLPPVELERAATASTVGAVVRLVAELRPGS